MIIDLFFVGNDGPEDRGSIIFENGKLTGTSDAARRIICEPLPVYKTDFIDGHAVQNGPPQFINPQEDPERFMQELPGSFPRGMFLGHGAGREGCDCGIPGHPAGTERRVGHVSATSTVRPDIMIDRFMAGDLPTSRSPQAACFRPLATGRVYAAVSRPAAAAPSLRRLGGSPRPCPARAAVGRVFAFRPCPGQETACRAVAATVAARGVACAGRDGPADRPLVMTARVPVTHFDRIARYDSSGRGSWKAFR